MYKYLRFWTKMTAVYLLYGILAAIGVLVYSYFIVRVDFKEYGMNMVWGVYMTFFMYGVSISKKCYGIPLSIAFGAVRKNTLKGYFFTEWILMILCTVIASVLGFNEINGKTFELISWLLNGAASGQYVAEAFGKGKKSAVIVITSTITLLLPFADFFLYSTKSSLMIEKPIVIFGIIYYCVISMMTIKHTMQLEVRV